MLLGLGTTQGWVTSQSTNSAFLLGFSATQGYYVANTTDVVSSAPFVEDNFSVRAFPVGPTGITQYPFLLREYPKY